MNWDWEKLQQKQKERSGGGVKPPQMDDLVDKIKEYKFPGGWVLLILAAFLAFFGSSMIYTVDTDQVAVVQRFGNVFGIA